jgi:hypothetical protein
VPKQTGMEIKMCLNPDELETLVISVRDLFPRFFEVQMMVESAWPSGARCSVCLTFDLDAEWVFMGNDLATHGWKHENIEPIERALKRPLIEHMKN